MVDIQMQRKAGVDTVQAQSQASRGVRRWPGLAQWLPPAITFALAIVAWQWYASGHPYVIPRLDDVWASLRESPDMYWANFRRTMSEILIGGVGGLVAGFLFAVLMAELPVFERALMPLFIIIMVTPVVALAPAMVVAFGFGMFPKYLVTGIVTFYPLMVNALAGLRDVDSQALDVFRTLHASRWETFWRLRVPSSLPFLFAGLKIALPLTVVGAVVAEFSASGEMAGLGALIMVAASQANIVILWASIFILCALGIAIVIALSLAQKKVVFWESGSQKRS